MSVTPQTEKIIKQTMGYKSASIPSPLLLRITLLRTQVLLSVVLESLRVSLCQYWKNICRPTFTQNRAGYLPEIYNLTVRPRDVPCESLENVVIRPHSCSGSSGDTPIIT